MQNQNYVLFSVTCEDRAGRTCHIRELFKTEPVMAFLMAVFDFEWTVRRAIVAMSSCPTKKIHEMLGEHKSINWPEYKQIWKTIVTQLCSTVDKKCPSLETILGNGAEACGLKKKYFCNLGNVLKVRHVLVHGARGTVPKKVIDGGLEMLLLASEIMTQYVDEHARRKMYGRIVRRAACKKCSCVSCPVSTEHAKVKMQKDGK